MEKNEEKKEITWQEKITAAGNIMNALAVIGAGRRDAIDILEIAAKLTAPGYHVKLDFRSPNIQRYLS